MSEHLSNFIIQASKPNIHIKSIISMVWQVYYPPTIFNNFKGLCLKLYSPKFSFLLLVLVYNIRNLGTINDVFTDKNVERYISSEIITFYGNKAQSYKI